MCVVAGTTNSTEPTWVVTQGAKTTDNTVTWIEVTGQPAVNGDATNTPTWTATRSVTLGQIIHNTAGTYYFVCTTAGTTGSSQPSFNTTTGVTTTDNTVTWTCIGSAVLAAWSAPHARIAAAIAWSTVVSSTVYVSSIHAETQTTEVTWSALQNYLQVICVSQTGSFPPTSSNVTTGATVTSTLSTSSTAISITTTYSSFYIYGIEFSCTGSAVIQLGGSSTSQRYDNCTFIFTSLAVNTVNAGSSGSTGSITWFTTCTFSFGAPAVGSLLAIYGVCYLKDSTFLYTYSSPAFSTVIALSGVLFCENTNFGAANKGPVGGAGYARFDRCSVLPYSTTLMVEYVNTYNAASPYFHAKANLSYLFESTSTVYLPGGANDGTTSFAWHFGIVSGVSAAWSGLWTAPFESLPISVWNSLTAQNVVVSFQGVAATLPTNGQVWLEVDYFGSASSTLGSRASSGLANVLATAASLPTSTSVWTAPARVNSQSYTLDTYAGSPISVSGSNYIFYCSTTGTTASSIPGGYATATPGTVVTDGTAHFTCMQPFTLTVTISTPQPQVAGYLICYIKLGQAVFV